jgi:hypothetical protein
MRTRGSGAADDCFSRLAVAELTIGLATEDSLDVADACDPITTNPMVSWTIQ